jgi:hypothetical protein
MTDPPPAITQRAREVAEQLGLLKCVSPDCDGCRREREILEAFGRAIAHETFEQAATIVEGHMRQTQFAPILSDHDALCLNLAAALRHQGE